VSMKTFAGKVLLIVNTATGCGFTPQYDGLEKLYLTYKDKGLEVLDFPCNQFAGQAPDDIVQIDRFCTLKYHTTFKRFAKIDVNGANESPLYTFLKEQKSGLLGERIKWNFTKFLVSRDGQVIKRYASSVKPEDIAEDIEKLLN
jgi:glutathione peroxidase